MNTLLAILKVTDARRDVVLAGGLYHRFPWRHLFPLAQGLFARPSLYLKLYLQFVGQLNSIVTDYGLLISIKNTMTFTT